jgi:hypothetical protein
MHAHMLNYTWGVFVIIVSKEIALRNIAWNMTQILEVKQ